MQEKMHGVVLNTIKYNDRNSIAHIYTDRHGLMSFLVARGNTQAARMRSAMFMPLSLIEFEANVMPNRDIATLHDTRRMAVLGSIYSDPIKNAITLFVSELLSRTIQEHEQNKGLFGYITTAVKILEAANQGIANFHICFLYHLGAFIGIQPDVTDYEQGMWFDMDGGVFTPYVPTSAHRLAPDDAAIIPLLDRMTFANMHLFKLSRDQRNRMLDVILAYYQIHQSTLGSLKSPEILKQLFV